MKRASPYGVDIGMLKVPDASFVESPEEAFQRIIHLALLKLPYLLAPGTQMGEGSWLFDPEAVLKEAKPPAGEKEVPKADDPEPEPDNDVETGTGEKVSPPAGHPPCIPHNIILYGPPGTGKTWKTVEKALELIVPEWKEKPREEQVQRYRELLDEGRIALVTFHQSYGYEEFVEGIRPVLDEGGGKDVRYTLQAGAFKSIALRAAAAGLMAASSEPSFDDLWARLLDAVKKEEDFVVQGKGGKDYLVRVSPIGNLFTLQCEKSDDGSLTISDKKQVASKDNARILWKHRNDFGGKPEAYTLEKGKQILVRETSSLGTEHKGGHHYTALWIVYRELFELAQRLKKSDRPLTPSPERAQAVLDGKSDETFVFTAQTQQFVLIIDEINRGNISKILGELITLLEADKRLTGSDETRLRLSNSHGHQFAVPPNLHVIGTMNTADRSIALMDVALRRRFDFEELMPSSAVLKAELEKDLKATEAHVQLVVEIFEALNQRIVWLYDRDHQIGHAYFLKATTLDALRKVFVDRVIPLLQEYFYGAWEKIAIVLGCPYDDNGNPLRKKSPVVDETQKSHSYRAPLIVVERSKVAEELGLTEDMDDGRLQFGINAAFRSSSGAELVPYFLSILALDHAQWKARGAALLASVEPASQGVGG